MYKSILFIPLIALSACVEEAVDGQQAFVEDCASCHGLDAKGAGIFGRQLINQPPDLTTLAARNGGVFDRDKIMSIIDGLHRDAHFSAAMPEFGAGDMGDVVVVERDDGTATPVPLRLLVLTRYLESLQR